MTRLHLRAPTLLASGLLAAVSLSGCLDRGGLDSDDAGGTGGKADAGMGTGGSAPGTGGASSGTGGASSGTGGAVSGTGGAVSGTGGAVSGTGGAVSGTGGAVSGTGGRNPGSGGRVGTGGNPGTGGVRGTGGTSGTGGTRGTGGSTGTGGKTMCGPVCDIFCPYGNVIDANGCATCQCKPGPNCQPVDCPIQPCPNGFVKDEKGCDICKCNPTACTPEECGPAPARTNIVICATGGGTDPGGAAPQPPSDVPAIVAPFVCQRNADGKCSWFSGGCRVCPAVTCTLACMNGFQVGADGCQICACKPAPPTSVCGGLGDPMTCAANAVCTWLAPGCTEPALAAAGCYAKSALGCTSDAQCGAGHQCLKRVVNPCYNSACTACALTQTICQ